MGDVTAVYTLFDASNGELADIWRACEVEAYNNGGNEWICRPGPKPCWPVEANASEEKKYAKVKELVEYHRENYSTAINEEYKQYDKDYFSVAMSPEWRTEGILAVTMSPYDFNGGTDSEEYQEDEEEWCKKARARGYDYFLFKPSNIGIMFINFQIANMGWDEYRLWEDVHPEKRKVDDDEIDDEGGPSKKAAKVGEKPEPEQGGPAPRKKLVSNKELEDIGVDPESIPASTEGTAKP